MIQYVLFLKLSLEQKNALTTWRCQISAKSENTLTKYKHIRL